jgi:uncharacterized protein
MTVTRIGLISDTHGLLRPQAMAFLAGSDHIVHAGDICDGAILAALATIAPVTAVLGNNDHGAWAAPLRETARLQLGAFALYAIHDLAALDIDPHAASVRVVVSGHSHKPRVEERDGVIFVNPGSAGPRRFSLPITAGEILIDGADVSVRTHVLMPTGT